jgi:hypothetical protein
VAFSQATIMYSNGVLAQALGNVRLRASVLRLPDNNTGDAYENLAATASVVQARGENKCEGYGTCYPMTEYEF